MNESEITVPVIEVSLPDDESPDFLLTRNFTVIQGIAFYQSSGSNSNNSHAWFPMIGMVTDYTYKKCPYLKPDQKRGLEYAAEHNSGWIIKVGSFFETDRLKDYIKRIGGLSSIKPLKKDKEELTNLIRKIIDESSEAMLNEDEIEDLVCRCGNIKLAAISACCALNMSEDRSFWTHTSFGKKMTQALREIAPEYFQTKVSFNIAHRLSDKVCEYDQIPVIINEFISTLNGYLFDGEVSNYTEAIDKYPSSQEACNTDSLNRFIDKLPKISLAPSMIVKDYLKTIKGKDDTGSSQNGCNIM